MLKKAIVTTVDACTRYAVQVIGIWQYFWRVVAGSIRVRHFAIDADVNKLISKDLPWRQREVAFDKSFPPKEETILAVVDAPTLGTRHPGDRRAGRRSCPARTICSTRSRELGGGPFFRTQRAAVPADRAGGRNDPQARRSQGGHPGAGPGPQPARADTGAQLRPDRRAEEALHARRPGRHDEQVADTLENVIAGQPGELLLARDAQRRGRRRRATRRRFIEIRPVLDFTRADARARRPPRRSARTPPISNFEPQYGARVRLTGPVPIADEEYATVQEGAFVNTRRHHPDRADHPVARAAVGTASSSRCSSAC